MAFLNSSGPDTLPKPRKPFPIERRPLMLKDFLKDDISSCSSNSFRSFPRRACYPTMRNLLETDLKTRDSNNTGRLLRSRSKAASATISALQKASAAVIKVVKNMPFYTVKSPSSSSSRQNRTKHQILPRSLSRRLLKQSFWRRNNDTEEHEIKITVVKVKDIIRWRSFRDLVEEKHKPSDSDSDSDFDFSSSPLRCTTTTAITTTTTTTATTSTARNSNSWSDTDFTSEYLQSWSVSSEYSGENELEESKKCPPANKTSTREDDAVGEDSVQRTHNWKGEGSYEEKEHFSPVSVLDFQLFEDDDDTSSFQQSLTNMERTKQKLMQKIRRFENLAKLEPMDLEKRIELSELDDVDALKLSRDSSCSASVHDDVVPEEAEEEEKARVLFNIILEERMESHVERLLLDFFKDGIIRVRDVQLNRREVRRGNDEYEQELVKVARNWINGCQYESLEGGIEGKWRKFEEEEGELALELEIGIFDSLVDELVFDF